VAFLLFLLSTDLFNGTRYVPPNLCRKSGTVIDDCEGKKAYSQKVAADLTELLTSILREFMSCRGYGKHRFHKLIQLLGGILTLSQVSAQRDGIPRKGISIVSNLQHSKVRDKHITSFLGSLTFPLFRIAETYCRHCSRMFITVFLTRGCSKLLQKDR
jgi:hypothetical protein